MKLVTELIHTRLVLESPFLGDLISYRIDAEDDLTVSLSTTTTADVDSILASSSDVVVVQIDFAVQSQLALIEELREREPTLQIMVISFHFSEFLTEQVVRLNLDGYLTMLHATDQFIDGLRSIAAGGRCFSPEVEERIAPDGSRRKLRFHPAANIMRFSKRQLEVLRHIAHGLSTREAASLMELTEKSVESHKYRIMKKLGIRDRVALARYAIRERIVPQ